MSIKVQRDRDQHDPPGKQREEEAVFGQRARNRGAEERANRVRAMRAGEAGGGKELPEDVRRDFEASFGTDLSAVRIHEDGGAESAGANAVATGADIHVAKGQYNPDTPEGRELLAHELTHVVQQAKGGAEAGDKSLEAEADTIGAEVAKGGPAPAHLQGQSPSAESSAVQFQLPAHQTYRVDAEDEALVAIADAVAAYNQIADARTTSEQIQECFKRLQTVERAAYAFMRGVSETNQQLGQNEHTSLIRGLLAEVDREQQELIAASRDKDDVLPFDTSGIDQQDLPALRQLWQDMLNNRGKIKVIGSDEYNQRIYGELARLLSTETGRSMLKLLNTENRPDSSPEEKAMTDVYIGETVDQLPEPVLAASPQVENQDRSEAQPLGIIDDHDTQSIEALTEATVSDIDPTNPPNPEHYPTVGPGELRRVRDFAWDTQYKGFVHNGKQYTFNRDGGTGAFVTSFPGISIKPGKGTGNEIHSPSWVTLGHELGHVSHMRSGATLMNAPGNMPDTIMEDEETDKWDNPEELQTIENVENELLKEVGLSERDGHRPPEWLTANAVQVRKDLVRPLHQLHADDASWYEDEEWKDLERRCRTLKAALAADEGTVEALRQEVEAFVPQKVDELLPGYLLEISNDQDKADTLMASLETDENKAEAMLYLHARRSDFASIKGELHYKWYQRIGNTKAQRAEGRVERFSDLMAE